MRRSALIKIVALTSLSLSAIPAFSAKTRKTDRRLLGTWRSDKERTVKLWRYKQDLTEEQKAKFQSSFGKLVRRYTETHAYSEFEDQKTIGRYRVVASDSRSVVLEFENETEVELQQVFFEGNSMYVFSGYNVEFFLRVEA